LDVNDSTGTIFHIDLVRFDELAHLTLTKMDSVFPIPWGAAICERVAMRFYTTSQHFVPGNPSQLRQRLSFKRCGRSRLTVVVGQFLERDGPCSGIAIRSESKIDMKDSFTPRLDRLDDGPSERFEIHVTCRLRCFMDEHQLEI